MPTAKKSIHAKLMDARKAFHAYEIKKTGYNDYSKYDYFELSDFLVPAMKILGEHDLIPIISFGTELATMTVYDITCDATIVITSPMSEANLKACQPVQSLGAVETFQRRYLWVALLEIVEHDAIEENTGKPEKKAKAEPAKEPEKKPAKPATDEDFAVINDYVSQGLMPEKTLDWLKNEDNWNYLTHSQATKIIRVCKKLEKGE